MDQNEQHERQAFFDDIANYQYIRDDGRLVLERFCVSLSHCFGFDGILDLSPQPRAVYMLLIDLIRERLGDEDAKTKIQYQNIIDWRPDLTYIYPERTMTCIHVGALTLVSHEWIYAIGHSLIGIPEPEDGGKYFAWAKEEWSAVFTFVNGFHNALYKFQKKVDRDSINKTGYSLFEALHVTRAKGIDFDDAVSLLKARHDSYLDAADQIAKAISGGYYLEAIALQECLISNCLYNFLAGTGKKLNNPSFHTLLKALSDEKAGDHHPLTELMTNLESWRKSRNTAIHGFVSSRTSDLPRSRADFADLCRTTALMGEEFCKAVVSWYEVECVNFIRHEFPRSNHAAVH